ncbi:phage tail tip fiber protein, partial [Ralstonia solanacearum]
AVAEQGGKLAAMYTIKTQIAANGRTYLAGIGVGVENDNGVIESQVLIAADR